MLYIIYYLIRSTTCNIITNSTYLFVLANICFHIFYYFLLQFPLAFFVKERMFKAIGIGIVGGNIFLICILPTQWLIEYLANFFLNLRKYSMISLLIQSQSAISLKSANIVSTTDDFTLYSFHSKVFPISFSICSL